MGLLRSLPLRMMGCVDEGQSRWLVIGDKVMGSYAGETRASAMTLIVPQLWLLIPTMVCVVETYSCRCQGLRAS